MSCKYNNSLYHTGPEDLEGNFDTDPEETYLENQIQNKLDEEYNYFNQIVDYDRYIEGGAYL